MEEVDEDRFFFNIRLPFQRPTTCVVAENVKGKEGEKEEWRKRRKMWRWKK